MRHVHTTLASRFRAALLVAFAAFLLAPAAGAAPGDLDATFGVGGTARLGVGNGNGNAHGMTLQLDGKLLVVGTAYNGSSMEFAILRYGVDDQPDPAFGDGGRVLTAATRRTATQMATDAARAVRVYPGSRFVVAGYGGTGFGTFDFVVARYMDDGTLDPTFGTNGIVRTDFGGGDDYAYAMAIQADGKIVVAGEANSGGNQSFAVARYNSDGSLDASFSGDGMQVIQLSATYDAARGVLIQGDGKLVLAGPVYNGGNQDIGIVRLDTAGSLDGSFAGFGYVIRDTGSSIQTANAVWYQAGTTGTPKIVVAGKSGASIAVFRYNLDGTPDTTFDGDGLVLTSIGGDCEATGLAVISSAGNPSRIQVAGYSTDANVRYFVAVRYLLTGAPDTAFDGDGIVSTPMSGGAEARALQLASGKVVVAGTQNVGSPIGAYAFTVARYDGTGALDPTFGVGGIRNDDIGGYASICRAAIPTFEGGLLAVGHGGDGANIGFSVVRLLRDGAPDSTFSGDGRLVIPFGVEGYDSASAVAVGLDGRIVVAGTTYDAASSRSRIALARLLWNGDLDPTFDGDGLLVVSVDSLAYGRGVTVQGDGRIVVGGMSSDRRNSDFLLLRFNSDGTPDLSFDGDGKQVVDFGSVYDRVNSMLVQPDGKILLAGSIHNGIDTDFAMARFHGDGSIDYSFHSVGRLTTHFAGNDVAWGLALQPDGKIVAAGSSEAGIGSLAMARYTVGGQLDATFDGDGRLYVAAANPYQLVGTCVQVQQDGQLLVGGSIRNLIDAYRTADYVTLRVSAAGAVDATYHGGIPVPLDFRLGSDDTPAVAILDPFGRLVLAGDAGGQFGFARYVGDQGITGIESATSPPAALSDVLLYPNPLNPEGTLKFTTGSAGPLRVDLFDAQGRLVKTLVDDSHSQAGTRRIRVDGTDRQGAQLASGVYFYRIESASGRTSGRVAIVR